MNADIQSYLIRSTIIISGCAGLVYVVNRKKFPPLFQWAGLYTAFRGLFEITGSIMADYDIPNLQLLHLYNIMEFIILGFFFQSIFRTYEWKKLPTPLIIGGVILLVADSLFIEPISTYNRYAKTFVLSLLITASLISFYLMIMKDKKILEYRALQLIVSAILLNSAGALFLYLFSHQIFSFGNSFAKEIWSINAVINFLSQLLFIISFWIIIRFNQKKV